MWRSRSHLAWSYPLNSGANRHDDTGENTWRLPRNPCGTSRSLSLIPDSELETPSSSNGDMSTFEPATGARFGYVYVPGGRSKNARRNVRPGKGDARRPGLGRSLTFMCSLQTKADRT